MEIQQFINEILTVNNPLLFAIGMTLIGKLISMSPFEDRHITWLLPIIMFPLYCLMEGWSGRHVMEGLVVGCAAIGINQGFRKMILPKKSGEPQTVVAPPPAPPTSGTSVMLVVGLLGLGALIGCATFEGRSYKALSSISLSVDAARLSYLDYVDTHGKDEATDKAIRAGYLKYQASMRMAQTIIIEYRKNKNAETENRVTRALNSVAAIADTVIKEIKTVTKQPL